MHTPQALNKIKHYTFNIREHRFYKQLHNNDSLRYTCKVDGWIDEIVNTEGLILLVQKCICNTD